MTDAEFLRQEIIPFFRVSSRIADQQKADRLESIAATLERCEQIEGELTTAYMAGRASGEGVRVSVEDARELHGLDTEQQVFFYEQDFYVLSNFSSFRVKLWGQDFDTAEHAYHWAKFVGQPDLQNSVLRSESAHEAFRYAQANRKWQRHDWNDKRVEVMREILEAKVEQHEYVRRKLLATGDRELVENSWRDDYWGWGPNRDGLNMLGNLWMELRDRLRTAIEQAELNDAVASVAEHMAKAKPLTGEDSRLLHDNLDQLYSDEPDPLASKCHDTAREAAERAEDLRLRDADEDAVAAERGEG